MAEVDLDAEFALFEQEIGGLDDEGGAESSGQASTAQNSAETSENSVKDQVDHSKSDRLAGSKRPVQTVYSSAPIVSAGQDDSMSQVHFEMFGSCFSADA